MLLLLFGSSLTTARAAGTVVGDGTPESCTLDALNQAITAVPAGGTITFNCGADPVTIFIADISIEKDLTIDGGGLIIFTGGNYEGTGFDIFAGATVQFMNFTVSGADGSCSGPINNAGTLTLHNVTLTNNSSGHACSGAGIGNYGTLTIEDSVIAGNGTDCVIDGSCGSGGGIGNYSALRVVNSMISGNNGQSGGGGIFNVGTATVENSTISENFTSCQTQYNGETGEPYLVSGNSTGDAGGGSGGGVYNSGTLFLQNTTIANNTAYSGGGLVNENSTTLQNSLLAGNKDTSLQPSDCSGTLTSQGYNLIGSTNHCTITGDTTGNLLGVDPRLGPLQDNGGPTFTHALLPGSPAIDAGNPAAPGSGGTACEATDQRGVTRPQGARCDIGAVEIEGGANILTVIIDIKPGDGTNPINLKSKGVIPVAIVTTSTFDATTVDPSSVTFGPSGTKSQSSSLEDVNGDGLLDLVLHFRTQQTGIQSSDTQACLNGQTSTGTSIQGCASIRIVP
jgi:hypothetical protein